MNSRQDRVTGQARGRCSPLQGYRRVWVRADAVAGLTVWARPGSGSAGVRHHCRGAPAVGLYAAVPSLVLHGAASSSRHQVLGPMSATAAPAAANVAPFAGGDGTLYIALTAALAIFTGILGLLAGMFRLGFIASFISEPLLKGLIVWLALNILIGQAAKFLVVPKSEGDFVQQHWGLINHLGDIQWLTFLVGAVGAVGLVLVLVCKKWFHWSRFLVAVMMGTAASVMFGLEAHGVEIERHLSEDHSIHGALTSKLVDRGPPRPVDPSPQSRPFRNGLDAGGNGR